MVSDFDFKSIVAQDDGKSDFLCNPDIADAKALTNWIKNFN